MRLEFYRAGDNRDNEFLSEAYLKLRQQNSVFILLPRYNMSLQIHNQCLADNTSHRI